MITIGENNNYDCDACGRRKQDGRLLMVYVGEESISLCAECAGQLADVLTDYIKEELT